MSVERATQFWQQAEQAASRADSARSEEMRRAWLVVARDWANMARHEEAKDALQQLAYVANVPTAPEAVETSHDDAERETTEASGR